jgi:alpha-beta hydrolase superfamily lysophospholipase
VTITLPDSAIGWNEPSGLSPRGTVIVLAGRGEAAGVYERFGRRIAADAWRVRVIDGVTRDVAGARKRAIALLEDESLPAPRVLVGSDAGGVLALAIAAEHPGSFDAVVLAGLPTHHRHHAAGSEPELRSACPIHRRTLDDESLISPGALDEPLPPELALPDAAGVALPVLAVHGDADAVVALADALPYYRDLPAGEALAVRGGRHDILNDVSHRSVAASVVLFLERLKAGGPVIVYPLVG